MSMPSSSASVAITARSSPRVEPTLEVAPLLGGVARAIRDDELRQLGVGGLQVLLGQPRQELDALARLHEADRARPVAHEPRQQLRRLGQRRAARAETLRRSAAGSTPRSAVPAPVSRPHRSAARPRGRSGVLPARPGWRWWPRSAGSAARCRTQPRSAAGGAARWRRASRTRRGRRVPRRSRRPQVGEQVRPGGVVGQDADMEHVRVGQQNVRALRRISARASRGVSPS